MRCATCRGSTTLSPSTSHRTGSLTSSTHQLWSSPRRTTHQSRLAEDFAIDAGVLGSSEQKGGFSRESNHENENSDEFHGAVPKCRAEYALQPRVDGRAGAA